MKDIKPIETHYKGYRFRSRLEARWAVFFDSYGLPYEYELEGYRIGNQYYLPDFYLPSLSIHVEVKPSRQIDPNEIEKLFAFALDGDKPLLLVIGTPGSNKMFLIDRHLTPLNEYGETLTPEIIDEVLADLEEWASVAIAPLPLRNGEFTIVYTNLPPYHDYQLLEAINKAKGSRFEFGENRKSSI